MLLTNWPNSSLFNTNVVGNVVSLFLDFKKALISMILRGNLILYQKTAPKSAFDSKFHSL